MLKNGSLKFLDNLCSQREKLSFQPILTTQKLHELLSFKKAQSQQPRLCPQNQKTGGKVIRTRTKKTDSRANLAFRQAAASLGRSQTALGSFYRRMKTKLGTPKAVVATAHKLARIVYHMLKYQVSFSAIPPEQEDERYRQRLLHNLQPKAQKLGAKLILETQSDSA